MAKRTRNPNDTAWKYRDSFQSGTEIAYAEFGEDRGWPGIPPWEVLEAIASHESDGTPDARNPNPLSADIPYHATGILQIVPNAGIFSTAEQVSGQKFTEQDLYDPKKAAYIGALGFGDKVAQLQDIKKGDTENFGSAPEDRGWDSQAAMWWYGGAELGPYGYRVQQNFGDVHNGITAPDFRDYIAEYVSGFDTKDRVLAGDWRSPSDPQRNTWFDWHDRTDTHADPALWNWVEGVYKVGESVVDGARSIDDVVDFITDPKTYVRIGAIAVGVAIVGIGVTALLL